MVVEDGRVAAWTPGRTLALDVDADAGMRRRADAYLAGRFGAGLDSFAVPDAAFGERGVFGREALRA